jgi:hypothetical protein
MLSARAGWRDEKDQGTVTEIGRRSAQVGQSQRAICSAS